MAEIKGTRTEANLKAAFAHEAQTNRRYTYFAAKAQAQGHAAAAALFKSTAEGEAGHAMGHLEWLEHSGDPATGLPFGSTAQNLACAVAGEQNESAHFYPEMAQVARAEGFDDIADWFETLAQAERSHAERYARALAEFAAADKV